MALESGAIGERIRVRNVSSQAVLEAEVIGPDRVRVVPGSTPIKRRRERDVERARMIMTA